MVWNANIPLITNVVSEDLLDMNENFAHLKNLIGDIDGSAFPANNNLVQFDAGTGVEDSGKAISEVGQLATAVEWTAQQNFNEATLTSSSNSVAWNLDTAQCAVHTLSENTTIAAPTNQNAGGCYVLRIVQAAGVFTLAWNAVFEFGDSSAPSEPAANADYIVCSFYSDGTNMIFMGERRVEA